MDSAVDAFSKFTHRIPPCHRPRLATSIVALVLFVGRSGVSFESGRGWHPQAAVRAFINYRAIFEFRRGLQKQITSVRSNLKSLDDLQAENGSLRVEKPFAQSDESGSAATSSMSQSIAPRAELSGARRFQTCAGRSHHARFLHLVATVTVNRGKQGWDRYDMPVVTDEGLVGKTTTVSANITIVLLVSDENCRLAANVKAHANKASSRRACHGWGCRHC